MEQALKILEAMGYQVQNIPRTPLNAGVWIVLILGGMVVCARVFALKRIGLGHSEGDVIFRLFSLLLLIFAYGFMAYMLIHSSNKYIVALEDEDFVAVSQVGVRLEPYDPAANTYVVRGMR